MPPLLQTISANRNVSFPQFPNQSKARDFPFQASMHPDKHESLKPKPRFPVASKPRPQHPIGKNQTLHCKINMLSRASFRALRTRTRWFFVGRWLLARCMYVAAGYLYVCDRWLFVCYVTENRACDARTRNIISKSSFVPIGAPRHFKFEIH